MKLILTLIFISAGYLQGYCQSINYAYDNAGNRNSRSVIALKSTSEDRDEAYSNESYTQEIDDRNIVVYPNPVQDQLLIEINGQTEELPSVINLYELNGKLIRNIETNTVLTTVSFANLPRGIYIMIIHFENSQCEWKINKE